MSETEATTSPQSSLIAIGILLVLLTFPLSCVSQGVDGDDSLGPTDEPPVATDAPPDTTNTPPATTDDPPTALYAFHDEGVKAVVERYFDKSADELTTDDFYELSTLHFFESDEYRMNVTTLRDFPELFPALRHIRISSVSRLDATTLSESDLAILEGMSELRAVEIYADGLPSLDFAERLPYASIQYTEEAYMSDDNNLAEASVLGMDFIEDQMTGRIREYVKVADGQRVYELIETDSYISAGESSYLLYETKVFVSEMRDGRYRLLESHDVPWRIGNISGGLIIADVNFDGQKDILVAQGHFGTQGLVTYACFLGREDGSFVPNDGGFSGIRNPSIDVQNQQILSTWRNWAASHSWAMYSYIDGEFIETDRLTWQPEEQGEGVNPEIISRRHTTEHFIYESGSRHYTDVEIEVFISSDYTDGEWIAMFYDEDSFWGLYSDKWRTLYNQGMLLDWSIYGGGMDAQIMEIISR